MRGALTTPPPDAADAAYRREFAAKLRVHPIRHTARLLDFQIRRLIAGASSASWRALRESTIRPTARLLRPPPYAFGGTRGPWPEGGFLAYWMKHRPRTDATYLPVLWSSLFLHAQTHRWTPAQFTDFRARLRRMLDEVKEDGGAYFSVTEYEFPIWDFHLFPRNVLLFAANGWGDVPIPLLRGRAPFRNPAKDVRVSFAGTLGGASDAGGVRSRMFEVMRDRAVFARGRGWRRLMERSTFTLAPRGLGPTSFRLYEALSVGSIPVYVWEGVEWLPYANQVPWDEISVRLPAADLERLPDVLDEWSAERVRHAQDRIAELHAEYFTMDGMSRRIVDRVARLSRSELADLVGRRDER